MINTELFLGKQIMLQCLYQHAFIHTSLVQLHVFFDRIPLLSSSWSAWKVMSMLIFCFACLCLRNRHRNLCSDLPPIGLAVGEITHTWTGVARVRPYSKALYMFVEFQWPCEVLLFTPSYTRETEAENVNSYSRRTASRWQLKDSDPTAWRSNVCARPLAGTGPQFQGNSGWFVLRLVVLGEVASADLHRERRENAWKDCSD